MEENKQQLNTIVVHAAGGAGINQSENILHKIADMGVGFANFKFNYLDTSTVNIDKINPRGKFWKVETSQHGKAEITGSGGERSFNASDISESVKQYLDSLKLTKMDPREYHLVIFSASGGSGNVCGSLVVDGLLKANIPTVVVVTGDSSNGLSAINTLRTLSSLDAIAVRNKKPLSIIYANNSGMNKGSNLLNERETDKLIYSYISTLALFLSSENEYLDNQDMRGIIDQSNYTTIKVAPGLYGLQFFSKEVELPEKAIPTMARTLTLNNQDYDLKLSLLHHKHGYITDKQAIELYEDQLPLFMVSSANFLSIEEESLKKVTDDYKNVMNSIQVRNIDAGDDAKTDDETGLIL